MSLEARKVQKLGSSSLVVTLPKGWVKRVKIKQGDVVYVIDEGATLRIVPRSLIEGASEGERIELDLDKISKIGVRLPELLTCMYVAGLSAIKIRGPLGPAELGLAKGRWTTVAGLEVLYDTDGVTIKCVTNVEKLGSKELARALAGLAKHLKAIAESRADSSKVISDAKSLVIHHIHALNRKLAVGLPPTTTRWEVPALVALGLLGLAMLSALSLAEECRRSSCTDETYHALAELAECTHLVAVSLAERKLHSASRASECAEKLRALIDKLIALDPYAAGRLKSVLDTVEASIRIALCVALAEKLEEG